MIGVFRRRVRRELYNRRKYSLGRGSVDVNVAATVVALTLSTFAAGIAVD